MELHHLGRADNAILPVLPQVPCHQAWRTRRGRSAPRSAIELPIRVPLAGFQPATASPMYKAGCVGLITPQRHAHLIDL